MGMPSGIPMPIPHCIFGGALKPNSRLYPTWAPLLPSTSLLPLAGDRPSLAGGSFIGKRFPMMMIMIMMVRDWPIPAWRGPWDHGCSGNVSRLLRPASRGGADGLNPNRRRLFDRCTEPRFPGFAGLCAHWRALSLSVGAGGCVASASPLAAPVVHLLAARGVSPGLKQRSVPGGGTYFP